MGRWVSADPLSIQSPGAADLNLYAFVAGKVLADIDPLGLAGTRARANKWTSHALTKARVEQIARAHGIRGSDKVATWFERAAVRAAGAGPALPTK